MGFSMMWLGSMYLKASNDNTRAGALRVVLGSLAVLGNIVQMKEAVERSRKSFGKRKWLPDRSKTSP